ncbi:hypothetical protein B0F90DRAFT_1916693 [Multifurca ochricompacta]|uniref:Uncharacterized protein n=1 Tax=Multifurca ochricompacta TaxID=376703 RepID=A0AAD4QQ05_9AGAM|nr:hypothetical protein B0F90DRAFT_1916693 [Multifurca ochricompacta]
MQVDRAPTRPTGDEDEESLFGSPPPSPVRGPGSAENVGTIALPGSHYCSELAIDPAILLLSSPSSTRDSSTPSTTTSSSPPSTLCSSSHGLAISSESSKAPKKPQNVKEGQQALLGHAGLIGGLDPSALFTRYHRGTTSQNPIIVEDELDPPLLGKQNTFSLHPSSLPSPSNEEVVSSLVKQRNIFPVLESLLRLLSGAGDTTSSITAVTPDLTSSSEPSQERGSAPKRRRLNSVPAGAADWDVPYPFQRGEGPSQYRLHWEKERLKQLLSQLAVLIKGAKRSAAARTYIQQHATSQQSAIPSFLKPPTRVSCQHQPPRRGAT